jgi:DNA-binding XRE family transcriptional regulator
LPFCHLRIRVLRIPYPTRWKCTQKLSAQPTTLGEHLKKARIERHLFQTDVARLLQVDRVTIQNWERGVTEPNGQLIPRIISFLGYDPEPEPRSIAGRIVCARRRVGRRQVDLAIGDRKLVDKHTVALNDASKS